MPLCRPVHVPEFGVLIPTSMPLRLEADSIVKLEVSYRAAPDENGLRELVTETFVEVVAARALSFACVRGRGRGCVVLNDVKMPVVNGKFQLPPFDVVDGLVLLGPTR